MRFIDNDDEFDVALSALGNGKLFFIDTEFESTRQRTTLSVLQVSAANAAGEVTDAFVLDALKLTRLPELGASMVRDDAEWVVHAGLQDVELLLECFRLPKPPRLFDTQIAWSLLGAEGSVSLAYLQYRLLGVRSMKSHQADNWMRRPLPASQIEYAASDIKYLPELYTKLCQELEKLQRRAAVSAACAELLWPKPEHPSELTFSSFRNAWQLEPKNQAALRFLVEWYNGLPAWERERAPSPKTMLSIASRLPKVAKDLLRIKGLPPHFSRGYAENLVHGINRAVSQSNASDFVQLEPVPYATFEEILLDAWLTSLRAEVSADVGVAPELAFPTRLMRQYRETATTEGRERVSELLEGWRKDLLQDSVKRFVERTLADTPSPSSSAG